jgi:hypothetical protein
MTGMTVTHNSERLLERIADIEQRYPRAAHRPLRDLLEALATHCNNGVERPAVPTVIERIAELINEHGPLSYRELHQHIGGPPATIHTALRLALKSGELDAYHPLNEHGTPHKSYVYITPGWRESNQVQNAVNTRRPDVASAWLSNPVLAA